VSSKRAKEEREYSKKRKDFLNRYRICQAGLKMCTHEATTVHHMEGRIGDLLNDESKWLAVCLPCHEWVETHPKEAKELNLSKNRIV
jgi:hypothetical protein